ncbi:glycosyltransferase family 2 protein [Pontibacter chitinilyticus]|uniref:glycosyltransferase family 2 protein n=1 Tax=Pontibacter chitinilyticus TaxID=2674989 RepID=UPI00321AAFFF
MSLVSVIIPNYNGAKYISECLNSCLNQGESIKEIIVIDDNSIDESWMLLTKYVNQYPKLINLFKNKGKGACRARNYGFELSTGDYILWLDSDDFLDTNNLQAQLKSLEIAGEDAISFSKTTHLYQYLDGSERRVVDEGPCYTSSENPAEFLLTLWGSKDMVGGTIANSAWLVSRKIAECAGPWNEQLLRDQDGEFFARAVLCSSKVIYTPSANTFYRKIEKGTSITKTSNEAYYRSELDALHLKHSYLLKHRNEDAFKKAFSKQYFTLAVGYYPKHMNLYQDAWDAYMQYNLEVPVPVLGGRAVEVFKRALGWRLTKRIKYLLSNLYN